MVERRSIGGGVRAWSAGALVLLTLGACTDPVGPGPLPSNGPPSTLMLEDADKLALMIEDASERIVPVLREEGSRDDLAVSLGELFAALEAGFVAPVGAALARSRSATERYAGQFDDPVTEADLAALLLALDVVARQVQEAGR